MRPPLHMLPVVKEKFPHIYSRIEALWIEPKVLQEYLNSLVMENSRDDRSGFPSDTFIELWKFLEFCNKHKVFGVSNDPWDKARL